VKLPEIIGISGTNGAGKDTLAALRHEKEGAEHVSLSDILRRELTSLNIPLERENLLSLSRKWRDESGDYGILATRTIARYIGDKAVTLTMCGLSIVSVRHPDEARRIKEAGGKVFWVDADPKLRYERIQTGNRDRIDDQKSFEEFAYEEQREINPVGADPASVNLGAVLRIADVRIENNFDDESAYADFLLDQYFSER
jgi:cytidylate kinase